MKCPMCNGCFTLTIPLIFPPNPDKLLYTCMNCGYTIIKRERNDSRRY